MLEEAARATPRATCAPGEGLELMMPYISSSSAKYTCISGQQRLDSGKLGSSLGKIEIRHWSGQSTRANTEHGSLHGSIHGSRSKSVHGPGIGSRQIELFGT